MSARTVYLDYITCEQTSDTFTSDDVYMTQGGTKFWGTVKLNNGDKSPINQQFFGGADLEFSLFEEETFSPDFLGSITIFASEPDGVHNQAFTNGAHYTLYYYVQH
jgi:hypothetical protein